MNTTLITNELYHIFDALNKHYFDNSLEQPFIIIKQGKSKSKNVYGTFTPNTWLHAEENISEDKETQKVSDEKIHEIAMSGEYLSRPTANMCATLCHEMVHLYCNTNNIEDTSNNGVYHNNKFKVEAEKRGLIIEKAPTIGWSVTTPTDEFIDFVKSIGIDEDAFHYFRQTRIGENAKVTPKKRWICPVCGQAVQGKKNALVGCWICGKQMDFVDITDEDNPEMLIDNNNGLAAESGWMKDY